MKQYKLHMQHHFDAAHQLTLPYESPCNNMHGHRWEVAVDITVSPGDYCEQLTLLLDAKLKHLCMPDGIIIDFKIVKQVIDQYDHKTLNDVWPFCNDVNPSAENLAFHLCTKVENVLYTQFLQRWKAIGNELHNMTTLAESFAHVEIADEEIPDIFQSMYTIAVTVQESPGCSITYTM